MSWIKLTGFSIIAAIFLALFFLCLITADFVLFRYLGSHLRDPEAESIIAARFQSDINLAQEARRNGYLPLVFPDYSSSDEEYIALSNAYNIFPLGALPNTNTYFCNEGYGLITYLSDRFGFRNVDNKWDNIGRNNSMLLIGDSFAHGACVSDTDVISARLNDLGVANLNLSISSNSAILLLQMSLSQS